MVVCDADEEFRKLLEMRLVNDGYDVRCVAKADDALEAILAARPRSRPRRGGQRRQRRLPAPPGAPQGRVVAAHPVRVPRAHARAACSRSARCARAWTTSSIKENDLEELIARIQNILTRESARRGEGLKRAKRGVTGQLENLGLPDIVQTLTIGMKTALVAISQDDESGRIWFRDGAVVHAKCGELPGEAAFHAMARWKTGEFAIEHGVKSRRTTIECDSMFLVMEAMRLMDEATTR